MQKQSKAAPKQMIEIGTSGLKRQAGQVLEEFVKELQGRRGVAVYREMSSNDPVIGALLFAIRNLIRRVTWREQPASSSAEDLANAEFVAQCRDDMNVTWQDWIDEKLSFLVYGWEWSEVVYKQRLGDQPDPKKHSRYNDGRYGWRKMPTRAQETLWEWEFDAEGGIIGLKQRDWYSGSGVVSIPIDNSLLFRTTTERANPEGVSLLRTAYQSWYIKKNIQIIEAIGIERDLAGYPVVWAPPEVLQKDATADYAAVKSELQDLVRNIRRDEQEGALMPLDYDEHGNKRWDLTLLSTGGSRAFDTNAIVQRYDQRIAMTVLADVILLGHEKVGSFALSQSKVELFATGLEALLDSIEAVINRFAIPRLFAVNGIRAEKLPVLVAGEVERVDLAELGEFIKSIAGSGVLFGPDEQLENHLRALAHLPERPLDLDIDTLPAPGPDED